MSIYFFLIAVVLLLPVAFSWIKDERHRDNCVLFFSILAIFLVMVLKAPTVGRDIEGYKSLYDMMELRTWSNFDSLSWMEWGYELLTMIFVHIFHAPFQVFITFVYAFVYFSYFKFIQRYSRDYTTSVLLYICFTFFTFDTSAIRTVLGIAICLLAVPFAEKRGIWNAVIFFAITILAAQIHKSAYIFIIVYFVIRVKFSIKSAAFYVGIPMILMVFRSQFYGLINSYLKTVQESSIALGGNLIVYIVCLLLTGFIWLYYEQNNKKFLRPGDRYGRVGDTLSTDSAAAENNLVDYFDTSGLAVRMIYMAIILQLFSTGTVLARMAEYLQLFILILVPNNIMRLNYKSRVILRGILYFFAVIYFWRFSLAANALDIVPYQFFWEV